MKIRIEIEDGLSEEELIIRCRELTKEVSELQKKIQNMLTGKSQITFFQGEKEVYLPMDAILFFESSPDGISAHTAADSYQVKYKLYELEKLLPRNFIRVSKSTILNVDRIFSITRSLTASSLVEFMNTHKQVYVSRYYYKTLQEELKEKRN